MVYLKIYLMKGKILNFDFKLNYLNIFNLLYNSIYRVFEIFISNISIKETTKKIIDNLENIIEHLKVSHYLDKELEAKKDINASKISREVALVYSIVYRLAVVSKKNIFFDEKISNFVNHVLLTRQIQKFQLNQFNLFYENIK